MDFNFAEGLYIGAGISFVVVGAVDYVFKKIKELRENDKTMACK